MDPSTLRGDDPEDRSPFHGEQPAPHGTLSGLLHGFFTGGNALVRMGIIILFFGVAFLVRYAAQHSHVPIEIRLTGVSLGGMALLMLGWRLRKAREGFALALQGGGIGILYLTVFAALHLYALIPTAGALALLIAIATLSAMLAVLQNSQSLALLGIVGGFLAPILATSGTDDHVFLFGYYLVLNAGILLVSWHKAWRGLNLAGFMFTFGIGTWWGVFTYRPEDFGTTEPFLIAIFLMYVGMAVLFTWRQPLKLRGYIDGPLVFGTPLAAFGLQASMLHDRHLALAYSALAVSGLYLGVAALLKRQRNDHQRMLIESFIALGVVFLTLAVPLALGSRWNAGAWALEGGALIWIGCRQNRAAARLFGTLLIFAAGCLLSRDFRLVDYHLELALQAFPAVLCLSVASMISAGALFSHAHRHAQPESVTAEFLASWAILWWVLGGLGVMATLVPAATINSVSLTFLSMTTLSLCLMFRALPLRTLETCSLFIVFLLGGYALNAILSVTHPLRARRRNRVANGIRLLLFDRLSERGLVGPGRRRRDAHPGRVAAGCAGGLGGRMANRCPHSRRDFMVSGCGGVDSGTHVAGHSPLGGASVLAVRTAPYGLSLRHGHGVRRFPRTLELGDQYVAAGGLLPAALSAPIEPPRCASVAELHGHRALLEGLAAGRRSGKVRIRTPIAAADFRGLEFYLAECRVASHPASMG